MSILYLVFVNVVVNTWLVRMTVDLRNDGGHHTQTALEQNQPAHKDHNSREKPVIKKINGTNQWMGPTNG